MHEISISSSQEYDQEGMRPCNRELLERVRVFVETPTAEQIVEKAAFAQQMSEIVAIGGRSGIGKTFALRHFAATRPHAWYCQFSPDTRSVYAVLSEIADSLGTYNRSVRPSTVRRAIVDRLSVSSPLLICDEAQNLTKSGFEEIRSLFDHLEERDGLGVVFAGHLDLLDKVANIPQLAGRASASLRIGEAKPADVDTLLSAWEFECQRTRQFLRRYAGSKTGLRRIAKVFSAAIKVAEALDEDAAFKHVERAWRAFDEKALTN